MGQHFETTSWSVISSAQDSDSDVMRAALESLCGRYWPPLYAYVRRKGYAVEEAQDLTQEFFAQLLSSDFLETVDRNLGCFRSFLMACMKNFLRDQQDKRTALKRGGDSPALALDFALAEERYAREREAARDPRLVFDRQWGETLLELASERLRREYEEAGKRDMFEALKGHLGRVKEAPNYQTLSSELDVSEGAVRTAVHRLRARFAALTREEIAQTVQEKHEIQEELEYLIRVMGA